MAEFALQSQSSKASFIREHDLESNPPTEGKAHESLALEAAQAGSRRPPRPVHGGTSTRSRTHTVGSQQTMQENGIREDR